MRSPLVGNKCDRIYSLPVMGLWRKVKGTIILAFSLFGALKN
ncbi:hypothetical protein [Microcoleus sp. FACHB-SPT15]|nr:hypothetical protein [Microcoleus sp. FACHB-SPT15]